MSAKALITYRSAAASRVTLLDSLKTYPSILRKKIKKQKLYAGDFVEGEIMGDQFVIEKIEPRKNLLVRPPVANVDNVLIVMAMRSPDFDSYLLDNFLAVYEYKKIEPIIIFNKIDLLEDKSELETWIDLYQNIGYEVVALSAMQEDGIQKIKKYIQDDITIVAGPSGAGKSTLLSKLLEIDLKTGEVNHKLGRGRHTTTAVTLYPFNHNSFIADTPGFSKVEATYFMDKREVHRYFREFLCYHCKFPDCTHTNEPGCAVKEAVKKGEISCSRFKNYLKIMQFFWKEFDTICK
ncbi:ribosome biogenesis GTPase / thiamine phosphate phosphatase [Nitratiruptor sp. YY08-26]|uniref:ribosome small subunit-dependent GTPase A n=1 Tax=unclassified Nitratiruptor TaxID=2624044 RepID=UPI0019162A2D|nr:MULTISPECIES: ribosome small subunit-dependent GTPase A [unclassified Nitratiruptor]BCD61301.1 ribosome biogenesis GTPase / thiamine phosphate phosphatase [Nitratiruptor sp. YY08-13]BCD65234.1 ribosome biogenesis GTPase / thiamine phosphate phosphatase [Nitratiruptor sp. YY08-26]